MLLDDFVKDLQANGISGQEIVQDIDEDTGMVFFRMPYKGMAVSIWLYEDTDLKDFCVRITAKRAPGQNNTEVLLALNTKNSEADGYAYFIDAEYPDEVGVGIHPSIENVSDIYEAIFVGSDTMLKELKDLIEIHED